MLRTNGSIPLYFSFRNQVVFVFIVMFKMPTLVQRVSTGWQRISKSNPSEWFVKPIQPIHPIQSIGCTINIRHGTKEEVLERVPS